ncbi:MAG: EthD family reductase [bacterium]|nr:EthD family reductase [bacterium]
MVKFMIVFTTPPDPMAFGDRYADFLALIERMPNIQRRQVIDILGSPLGTTRYHRILEVYFQDYAAMQGAMMSAAGQEAGREISRFPAGTYDLLFAEVYEETGGSTPGA